MAKGVPEEIMNSAKRLSAAVLSLRRKYRLNVDCVGCMAVAAVALVSCLRWCSRQLPCQLVLRLLLAVPHLLRCCCCQLPVFRARVRPSRHPTAACNATALHAYMVMPNAGGACPELQVALDASSRTSTWSHSGPSYLGIV